MIKYGQLVALGLMVSLLGCRASMREISQAGEIGKNELVGIRTGDEKFWAAVREVKTPATGVLHVIAEAQLPGQNLEIIVMPPSGGGLPLAKGSSPLESPKLPAGTYFVIVQGAPGTKVATRATLNVLFKPENPDENSGNNHTKERATKLELGKPTVAVVDYASANATDWYQVMVPTVGDLEVKFVAKPIRGAIKAEFIDSTGKVVPLTESAVKVPGVLAGDYFIKVAANDVGAGEYVLSVFHKEGSPDANSGEDATSDGANLMNLVEKNGRIQASAKDEVSYDKQDATDWFKIEVPNDGKLSIVLKPKDRSSRIRAEFVKGEDDDEGERVRSGFSADVVKQTYWIKVYVTDKGDATSYTLDVTLVPVKFIESFVVEIDRQNGCFLLVNKGTNHGVRSNVPANVMEGKDVRATGVVDSAFAAISKIRMFGDCNYRAGAIVQIQDVSY